MYENYAGFMLAAASRHPAASRSRTVAVTRTRHSRGRGLGRRAHAVSAIASRRPLRTAGASAR